MRNLSINNLSNCRPAWELLDGLRKLVTDLGRLRELLLDLLGEWLASLRCLRKLLGKLRWLRGLLRSQGSIDLRELGPRELLLLNLGWLREVLAWKLLLIKLA